MTHSEYCDMLEDELRAQRESIAIFLSSDMKPCFWDFYLRALRRASDLEGWGQRIAPNRTTFQPILPLTQERMQ